MNIEEGKQTMMNVETGKTVWANLQINAICLIMALFVLSGCASQVTKPSDQPRPEIRALRNVTLQMSPSAVQKIADNVDFDMDALKSALMQALESRQLVAPDGGFDLDVVINEVRIRGTGTAVMLGFLAGDDRVIGDALVANHAGDSVYKYRASASYALGGLGGGDDTTRVNWLYEKFSEIVADELVAVRNGKE